MTVRRSTRASHFAFFAAIAALVASYAAGAQHEHEHATAAAAVANLQLDGDHKWPTDATLRSGMAAIHAAFEVDHPAIHAGRETNEQYETLAGIVATQVDTIVANCKLPPAADANLHYVVADLLQGVSLMRGEDAQQSRHDGAARVHGALLAYPQFFDDPDWKD